MAYTYEQAEAYINSIQKFAKKNTLEHTKQYLRLLGNPCRKAKIIHVAGTNGKGSVCSYLNSLLLAGGSNACTFISPHLVTMRERMLINGEMVTEEAFVRAFERVMAAVSESAQTLYHPTFFEFLFLMAMLLFGEAAPDYVILETGMGGRLDATNVFDKPVMTVITEIGLDHCQYLGDTKEKIAAEKAGIIKNGTPLVYVNKEKTVSDVLSHAAAAHQSVSYPVDKRCFYDVNINDKTIDFSYKSRYYNNVSFALSTTAAYQAENAAAALLAYELLIPGQQTDIGKMQQALFQTRWQGRMEEIAPDIYLDGAHNDDGIDAFLESVRLHMSRHTGRSCQLLFSVVSDKDCVGMIHRLEASGLFDEYMIACLHDARGLSAAQICTYFRETEPQRIHIFETVPEAYRFAVEKKGGGILYIAGSLYLAGEIKSALREEP